MEHPSYEQIDNSWKKHGTHNIQFGRGYEVVEQWCLQNLGKLGNKWTMSMNRYGSVQFWFKNPEDFVLFQFTWL